MADQLVWSYESRSEDPLSVARRFAREYFAEPREVSDVKHRACGDDGSFCGSFWLVDGAAEYRITSNLAGLWEVVRVGR